MARLTAKQRAALPSRSFAVPADRDLPIHDKAHVRAAMARFDQTGFKAGQRRAAFRKIVLAARRMGIDSQGFREAHPRLNKRS